MLIPQQYRAAEDLEQFLGDPADPEQLFSFRRAVELDEAEQYPEEPSDLLNQWGLAHYFVPEESGGRLRSYEELLMLLRVVARRDLTVAIGYGKTYLGAVAVWVGGTLEQQRRVFDIIKRNGQLALAYNEKAHGSDLLATEVEARQSEGGYVLNGEKWLINNATRGVALTVFARTQEGGGPRGFSLFLVEKRSLDTSSFEHLPKQKTLGARGSFISGIRFKECEVAADALIGSPGLGLELTLRAFQLTRTVVPGLSLGAADTALRCVLDFALGRRLYGETVFEIAQARQMLVGAFIDLWICDCVAIAAARALHSMTEQMRLYSAVTKYFVPTKVEEMVRQLSIVLGARHYLREGHWSGVFQKIVRDSGVISVFHAGTFLSLLTVALHLRDLAHSRAKNSANVDEELQARLRSVFFVNEPLANLDTGNLVLYSRGRDDIMRGLESVPARLEELKAKRDVEAGVLEVIAGQTREVLDRIRAEDVALKDLEREQGTDFSKSPEMFELAKNYCVLHAASSCLLMWLHNRHALSPFFARGEWLALALERLLRHFGEDRRRLAEKMYTSSAAEEMVRLFREDLLFSIIPLQLARSEKSEGRQAEAEAAMSSLPVQ